MVCVLILVYQNIGQLFEPQCSGVWEGQGCVFENCWWIVKVCVLILVYQNIGQLFEAQCSGVWEGQGGVCLKIVGG